MIFAILNFTFLLMQEATFVRAMDPNVTEGEKNLNGFLTYLDYWISKDVCNFYLFSVKCRKMDILFKEFLSLNKLKNLVQSSVSH